MPTINFVGQSLRNSSSKATASSRLLCCYREPTGEGTFLLRPVPGLTGYADLPGIFVRAMATVEGLLYVACGGRLYQVNSDATFDDLGEIEDGPTTLAGNNGLVTICVNGRYWVWNGTALSEPTAGAFASFGALTFFGNYTVLTEEGARRFQWSDIADATDLPGLNFSTADGRDDTLIRPYVIGGQLYLWKETSHEIWYLTGGAGAEAFERAAGGIRDVGLKAFGLISTIQGGAFMVGDDNRAYIVSGSMQPVSTPAVEEAIAAGTATRCVTYEKEGHTFCAIIYSDRAAWVFDIATGEWHERSEGLIESPWSLSATAKWRGAWYAGRNDGRLFVFGGNTDGGVPITKEAVTQTLKTDDRIIIRAMEAFVRKGLEAGGITLSLSRDNGVTFGTEKVRDVGPVGDTDKRIIWRNLGQFRQATARLRWDGDFSVRSDVMVIT